MATGKNNFKIFNESMDTDRTLNDSDYSQSTQRQTGVIPGVAQSKLHNKLFRQVSGMSKAIADFISGKGYDCVDTDVEGMTINLEQAIKVTADGSVATHNADYNAHSIALNFWQKSKVYAVGNMIFPKVHGSQYCFICTQAGTTGTSEPSWVYTDNTVITDNTCKWTVSRISAARDFVFATTATALASGGTGVVGTSSTYARGDHTHTLPTYPTTLPANGGNSDTVDGAHAGNAANNVLKLDSSGKVPAGNLPPYPVVPGWGTATTALVSGGTGAIGSAGTIARSDHTHTLPAYPTSLPANGGSATTATKLAIVRTISLTGKVTGTPTAFDGSANISINATAVVADSCVGNSATATKAVTADSCTGNAATATKATQDSDGNIIKDTYTKTATFADNVISALASKTLSSLGVAYSMGSTGYVSFGPLFGGLIIQWGVAYNNITQVLPISFNSVLVAVSIGKSESVLGDAGDAAPRVRSVTNKSILCSTGYSVNNNTQASYFITLGI